MSDLKIQSKNVEQPKNEPKKPSLFAGRSFGSSNGSESIANAKVGGNTKMK